MNWWKRRRLRIAREKYAYWKARVEAMQCARTAPLAADVFHPLSAALSLCVKASGFRHAIQ